MEIEKIKFELQSKERCIKYVVSKHDVGSSRSD